MTELNILYLFIYHQTWYSFQERACEHVKDPRTTSFFASPQCIDPSSNKKLTYEMCLPPKSEILKKTKKIVKKAKAKRVFVATDNDPMIRELTETLKSLKVCGSFVWRSSVNFGQGDWAWPSISRWNCCLLYLSIIKQLLDNFLHIQNYQGRGKCGWGWYLDNSRYHEKPIPMIVSKNDDGLKGRNTSVTRANSGFSFGSVII